MSETVGTLSAERQMCASNVDYAKLTCMGFVQLLNNKKVMGLRYFSLFDLF